MSKIIKKSKERIALKIVKRKGHREIYDGKKVHDSCYFACRNAHLSEKDAEKICYEVSAAMNTWASKKKTASSREIFRALIHELKKYNEEAAFLYETHRDIS